MQQDKSEIKGFHAHVYYDESSRATAAGIRESISDQFEVEMGRWRDKPVGPHPQAMYQVAFQPEQFESLVPWLMLNHSGLNVLIHRGLTTMWPTIRTAPCGLGKNLS